MLLKPQCVQESHEAFGTNEDSDSLGLVWGQDSSFQQAPLL